jgi:hypothetical protein
MKNAPETMTTMSSVDHRDALASLLDGEIMQLNRRRDVVQAQIDSLLRERSAIDDAVEVANNSITELKDRQVGLTTRETE